MSKKELKERTFQFTERVSESETKTYIRKESELNEKETEVLLNNLVKEFNGSPRKVQQEFVNLLVGDLEAKEQVTEVPQETVNQETTDTKEN